MALFKFLVQPLTRENVLLGAVPDFSCMEVKQSLALRIPHGFRSLGNVKVRRETGVKKDCHEVKTRLNRTFPNVGVKVLRVTVDMKCV